MLKNILLSICLSAFSLTCAADSEKIKKETLANTIAVCTACHGHQFEKIALNKSTIVKGQSAADIETSLMAYKANIRNKDGFGALMNSRVKNISDADIKIIAAYIANIK